MTDAPLLPGWVPSRFEALRLLGEGGFGRVVLARDRDLDRDVALKVLHERLSDEESRRRFAREAQLTAGIRHPHVVTLLSADADAEGHTWIAYEFVPGRSLGAELEGGPLAEARVRRLGVEAAGALQAVHDAGVVHRDVKPENVLLRPDGSAVLCDLGIARRPDAGTQLTADGLILGTAAYLAPEAWLGATPSPEQDQFALAATLYEARWGRGVYPSEEVADILDLVRKGRAVPVPPEGADGGALAVVLRRALALAPEDRYPDLGAFATALEALTPQAAPAPSTERTVALGRPTRPPHGAATTRLSPDRRTGLRLRAAGALGGALALGLGAILVTTGPTPPPPVATPAASPPPAAGGPDVDPEIVALERRIDELLAKVGASCLELGDRAPLPYGADGPHIEEVHARYLEEEFTLRFADLFEALLDLDRAASSPGRADLPAEVHAYLDEAAGRWGAHLMEDLDTVEEIYSELMNPPVWILGREDRATVIRTLGQRTDRLIRDLEALFEVALDRPHSDATLGWITAWLSMVESPRPDLHRRTRDRLLERDPWSPAALPLLTGFSQSLGVLKDGRLLSQGERREGLRRVLEHVLAQPPPEPGDDRRRALLGKLTLEWLRTVSVAGDRPAPSALAILDRLADATFSGARAEALPVTRVQVAQAAAGKTIEHHHEAFAPFRARARAWLGADR